MEKFSAFSGVNNSFSSHVDIQKIKFLVLCEKPTEGINGIVGATEKKFRTNFSKTNIKFYMKLKFTSHW